VDSGVAEAVNDLRHSVKIFGAVDGMIEPAAVRIAAVKSFACGEPLGGFGT